VRFSAQVAFLLALVAILTFIKPTFGYSRIVRVDLFVPLEGEVAEEIPLQADIYTGNNRVEYTHNVEAALLLPEGARLVSGNDTVYVGEMGPGPAYARCRWTVAFESVGEYLLMVNASCVDTQGVPRWMNASATIEIYGPPLTEFEYTPTTYIYVNDTVTFNATKSSAQGPSSKIITYAWDFGDGTNATTNETIIEHRFSKIGNYTISLNVTDDKELSTANSTIISISLLGDLNSDGRVNIEDIAIVARSFYSLPGDERWNEKADLNHDNIINILDITIVAKEYGKKA
jgi:PKD repeat protein